MKKIAMLSCVVFALSCLALAVEEKEGAKEAKKDSSASPAVTEHKVLNPSELKWADAPPGLPPGAKMAVLDGDPTKKGSFTVRLQSPAGYKVMPHTHPMPERVTVISGTFYIGMGDKFDEAAGHEMAAGSFVVMPAGMKHFAWSTSEAVIQINSDGPFQIKYVNPADDPRGAKKPQ